MKLEKNVFYKIWSPKFFFFFFEKMQSIFLRKLTLKVQFRHCLTNPKSLQDCFVTISFEHVDSWAKLLHFRTHQL